MQEQFLHDDQAIPFELIGFHGCVGDAGFVLQADEDKILGRTPSSAVEEQIVPFS